MSDRFLSVLKVFLSSCILCFPALVLAKMISRVRGWVILIKWTVVPLCDTENIFHYHSYYLNS